LAELAGIAIYQGLGSTAVTKFATTSLRPLFEQVPSAVSGIAWRHVNGRSPEYLPETTGAGCAFLDYDNDGWMDIHLVNSGKCDFLNPNPPLRNTLYHNNRDGTFTDVTEKAGVLGGGYGMGVAVGDYDKDGWPDLYVTQYGRSILYHNNGDGTFTDMTEKAGVAAPGWASSAVDNDGWMDLFVANDAVANFLFVNKHNRQFEDAALEAGVAYSQNGRERSGMGVDSGDFDRDGWRTSSSRMWIRKCIPFTATIMTFLLKTKPGPWAWAA